MTFGFGPIGTTAIGDIGIDWIALQTPAERRLRFPASRLAQRTVSPPESTMTIVHEAIEFEVPIDPAEEVDFILDLSTILEDGEAIEDFTLVASTEAIAAGLSIVEGHGRDAAKVLDERGILLWLELDPEVATAEQFSRVGTRLPIEVSITTTSVPQRVLQRTFLVRVRQL